MTRPKRNEILLGCAKILGAIGVRSVNLKESLKEALVKNVPLPSIRSFSLVRKTTWEVDGLFFESPLCHQLEELQMRLLDDDTAVRGSREAWRLSDSRLLGLRSLRLLKVDLSAMDK